jgi:aspartate kinase
VALVVKKFGGTSVGNIERIKRVAKIVANSNEKVIVVVSAMAGVTNQLVQYTGEIGTIFSSNGLSEYDAVISAGEQITTGLMALALISLGLKATSYLGWQVPINTSSHFSQSKILDIHTDKLLDDLAHGIIPVIAGFQGISNGRITTLGRGGSDTTAAALAIAIGADRCDIYTDVDGIYSADPRVVPKAKKIRSIDYESALEMASAGAQVIHPRAVEMAMLSQLPIRILNTFSDELGTEITEKRMEKIVVNGIAVTNNLILVIVPKVENIDHLIHALIKLEVVIESITQSNLSLEDGDIKYDYTILTSQAYLDRCIKLIGANAIIRDGISRISVIGIGVKGFLKEILQSVQSIIGLQVLETQVSFLVESINSEKIVRTLHTTLNLD